MIYLRELNTSTFKNMTQQQISRKEDSTISKKKINTTRTKWVRSDTGMTGYAHIKKHFEKIGKNICLDCGLLFDSVDELQEHYNNTHPQNPDGNYPCKICHKEYKNCDMLAKHTKEIHDQIFYDEEEAKFKCEFCDNKFLNNNKLREHIRIVHKDNKPCTVPGCGKVFQSFIMIRRHRLRKHGIKPSNNEGISQKISQDVICDDCGKVLKSTNLQGHKLRHHTKSEEIPCETCGKIMSCKQDLKMHIKKTHENPHVPCDICGNMVRKHRMKHHMWTKHPTGDEEFAYNCEICGRGFFDKHYWKHHMNTHTGEKPHKCKYCGLGFAHPRNAFAHEKSVHEGIKRVINKNKNPESFKDDFSYL